MEQSVYSIGEFAGLPSRFVMNKIRADILKCCCLNNITWMMMFVPCGKQ